MKPALLMITVLIILIGVFAWVRSGSEESVNTTNEMTLPPVVVNMTIDQPPEEPARVASYPMDGFRERITKKSFGDFITPESSPIQPERFSGYHTGVDLETTDEEQDTDVPVYAIADGTITLVRTVDGYGGVVLVKHVANGETITALYGHVRLSSVTKTVGDTIVSGKRLAVLGTGGTDETDGERKHLHFGLLRGSSTNVRGYVTAEEELGPWIDPVAWFDEMDPSTRAARD